MMLMVLFFCSSLHKTGSDFQPISDIVYAFNHHSSRRHTHTTYKLFSKNPKNLPKTKFRHYFTHLHRSIVQFKARYAILLIWTFCLLFCSYRKLYPKPMINITGMEKHAMYYVAIEIEPLDNKYYTYKYAPTDEGKHGWQPKEKETEKQTAQCAPSRPIDKSER